MPKACGPVAASAVTGAESTGGRGAARRWRPDVSRAGLRAVLPRLRLVPGGLRPHRERGSRLLPGVLPGRVFLASRDALLLALPDLAAFLEVARHRSLVELDHRVARVVTAGGGGEVERDDTAPVAARHRVALLVVAVLVLGRLVVGLLRIPGRAVGGRRVSLRSLLRLLALRLTVRPGLVGRTLVRAAALRLILGRPVLCRPVLCRFVLDLVVLVLLRLAPLRLDSLRVGLRRRRGLVGLFLVNGCRSVGGAALAVGGAPLPGIGAVFPVLSRLGGGLLPLRHVLVRDVQPGRGTGAQVRAGHGETAGRAEAPGVPGSGQPAAGPHLAVLRTVSATVPAWTVLSGNCTGSAPYCPAPYCPAAGWAPADAWRIAAA